jgi:hypothetical protein
MSATGPTRRRVRRNRISERDAVIVGVVAVAAGVAAALAGAEPAAWPVADAIAAFAFVGFVTWAAASAPWWVLAVGAAVATLTATDAAWAVVGALAFVIAAVIGSRALSLPWLRAVACGLTINALLRWDQDWFHGWSALVTAGVAVTIAWLGLNRRGRLARRTVRRVAVVIGAAAGIAVVGAAVAALAAQGKLREGEREFRTAADAIRSGDIAVAVESLERSHALLREASAQLDRPWAKPVLAVPWIGQHVDAVTDVTTAAEELAASVETSVAQINVDALQMINGVTDLTAIDLLEVPFRDTSAALARTDAVLDEARTPWLLAPLGDRIDELHDEVSGLVGQTDRAADAVVLAPSMLGADGPRTYFVAFTTPAESRGLGGFMGTFAELRADGGRLTVERTGTTSELNGALGAERPVLDMPEEYHARYGRFGAGAVGEPVSVDFWSNITMPPDLPTVTDVVAQLYPAGGGREIDGVVALDVDAIARFLELTGPITVAGPDGAIRLDEHNAAEYLLREQYAAIADDDVRDAVLEQLTSALVTEVFGGTLPAPRALATTLGPAMAQGRLTMWSLHEEDQELLTGLGVSGALPAAPADGLAVVSNNAGANKLDAYLRRSITYEVEVAEPGGELRSAVTVRLANDAPTDLPPDAGGNPFGLPPGTNRMYLSIYSPWEFTSAEVDGELTGMEAERELGWNVYSTFVDIPAGGEVAVRLGFAGTLPADGPYSVTLRSQALAFPDVVRIDARTTEGDVLVQNHGLRFGVETFTGGY